MSEIEEVNIHFESSDGRVSYRDIDWTGGKRRMWRVPYLLLDGEYAIHQGVFWPDRPKPENKVMWWTGPGGVPSRGRHKVRPTELLYVRPELNGQRSGLLVEGEKCADAVRPVLPSSWVVAATVTGSGPIPEKGVLGRLALIRRWYLWPDADRNGKGQDHMRRIADYMKNRCEVRMIEWRGAPDGGDVADFLLTHTRRDLMALIANAKQVKP